MVIIESMLIAVWVLCSRLGKMAEDGHMVWQIVINEEAVHIDQARRVIVW